MQSIKKAEPGTIMAQGVYKISYANPMGIKLKERVSFSAFDLQRRVNEIGKLTLSIANPAEFPVGYFTRDGRIDVRRSVNGLPYYLEGETTWLINRVHYATDDQGHDTLDIQASDALDMVRRRIVAYDNGSTYTAKLGFADDEIVDIIDENLGASAIDTDRDLSAYLSTQAGLSAGAIVGDDIGWKKILDVLRNFSDSSDESGVRVIYDVVPLEDGTFEFRTYPRYRGVDHSADSGQAVIVAQNRRNLKSPELIFDYTDEINAVYVGGKGEGAYANVVEATDSERIGLSPFARTEAYINASNVTDPAKLAAIANAALKQGRPRVLFSGQILDTPAASYGIHFRYGDLVTAVYRGRSIDCAVDSIHISYSREGGEQLEILLKGEQYV